MNAQEQFWSGDFGNSYTARNRVDWRARIPFWKRIIDRTGARSVYEVGTNCGWNLSAIRRAYPDVAVYGEDINERAVGQARTAGLKVSHIDDDGGWETDGMFDIIFTAGVLIHVAPENLQAMMQQIVDASAQYVLAVEYAALQEEEVEYRGHSERLWKRPYGVLYAHMGLRLIDSGDAEGFDRCTYWLMEKR